MAIYELTEALKEKLEKAQTLEEMVLAFNEEGIEITKEQLEEIKTKDVSEVLDEDDLDSVTGGSRVGVIMFIVRHGIYIKRLVDKCMPRW